MFSMVLAVTNEGSACRYLDLKQADVQDAIMSFTGNTAKTLFTGPLSKEYKIIKTEFAFNKIFKSIEELKKELDAYVLWYNYKRIHSALNYMTPVVVLV